MERRKVIMSKSNFCQWLADLQQLANEDNIIIEAQHYDCLNLLYHEWLQGITNEEAYARYKDFRKRWHALVPESFFDASAAVKELLEEMAVFIERVDKGEVRSTKTYQRFLQLTKKYNRYGK